MAGMGSIPRAARANKAPPEVVSGNEHGRIGMKITAIRAQRRQRERLNVHVDGEFRLALPSEVILRRGLRAGMEITEAAIRELEAEDLAWKARQASLTLLSYRPRTARELQRRLERKDFPGEVARATVEDLRSRGLVDDAAFAESFVRDRMRMRPRGRRRLIQELRAKGVDPDAADSAISRVLEGEDASELDLARKAAERWAPRAGEEPRSARRRLHGFLARRGFGSDAIRTVMDEIDRS